MPENTPLEPTLGEIARRVGEPIHRIEYVIRSRNIQPARLAGNCRIFADNDVERIAEELRLIDAGKKLRHEQTPA